MLKQPWSLGSTVPALCPKCNAEALHRSHAHSTLEEKRKQLSHKRPYRCHECQWRGWLEEAQLRYSAAVVKSRVVSNHAHDVDIPDIALDEDAEERHPSTAVPESREDGSHDAKRRRAPSKAAASGRGQKEASPTPNENAAAMHDASELSDEEQLPDFDDAASRVVTGKVDAAFHHQARHTEKRCPACDAAALFRSRSRSFGEGLRKKMTSKRLYRCHRCGWRGWLSRGF